jgi:hypothetical protein
MVDDPRFIKLLREFPTMPVADVQMLYRLDLRIDELKYRGLEHHWEQDELEKKRKNIIDKGIKEIEK